MIISPYVNALARTFYASWHLKFISHEQRTSPKGAFLDFQRMGFNCLRLVLSSARYLVLQSFNLRPHHRFSIFPSDKLFDEYIAWYYRSYKSHRIDVGVKMSTQNYIYIVLPELCDIIFNQKIAESDSSINFIKKKSWFKTFKKFYSFALCGLYVYTHTYLFQQNLF